MSHKFLTEVTSTFEDNYGEYVDMTHYCYVCGGVWQSSVLVSEAESGSPTLRSIRGELATPCEYLLGQDIHGESATELRTTLGVTCNCLICEA